MPKDSEAHANQMDDAVQDFSALTLPIWLPTAIAIAWNGKVEIGLAAADPISTAEVSHPYST